MSKSASRTAILQTQNLSIGYSGNPLISNLNLSFYRGELVAIFGVNGSGKSTFLKTLSREIIPVQGRILLAGSPLQSFTYKAFAKHLSVVLTRPVFSQNLTVKELIALGRFPYNNWLGKLTYKDHQQINKVIEQMTLTPLIHKKCTALSDGQLQKVFIARALAQNTGVILLDEPTNHLDLYFKFRVFKLLKDIAKQQNKSILVATHELNLALQICDKIMLIHDEKVLLDTPKELIKAKNFEDLFPGRIVQFQKDSKTFQFYSGKS